MASRYRASHQPPPATDPMDRLRFPVDPWRLVETRHDTADLGATETLFAVGNGYLGMRGNPEEGRDSHSHGTFINGFHEVWPIQHAEEAFGFARTGQTIVHAPDTNLIKLYADDEPILLSVADTPEYERSIDFRDGTLRRNLIWRTPAGNELSINSTRMVSMSERHLAVMTMEIEVLTGSMALTLSSQVLNRQDGKDEYYVRSAAMGEGHDPRKGAGFQRRVLNPQWHWHEDQRMLLGFQAAESGMTLAVGADHEFSATGSYERNIWSEEDSAKIVYRVQARKGDVIRLVKYASYHTSRGVPTRELTDRVRRTLDRAKAEGVEKLRADQRRWFDKYWDDVDVEVAGQPELQQAIRWNLFQLAQATGRADSDGIAAKGVTGSGYSGHYFWDTEIYVMPFLTYTRPAAARNALRFRYNMLDAARERATEMTQDGALFPWRTINGEEASAYYAAGTAQYHIDADIAYAMVRYVLMSGDVDFLLREGVDVLVETARMWADLGFWRSNGDEAFHIHGVTGPDEYNTVVNDNFFTNVMAQHNLQAAVETVRELQETDPV
ncbi:MAG: glycoside hydrolase family 65 protein, partial [Propionibacterium sp.]|nr:glycoside hydrolase family 65 protein [Propionibacterium sp.]